MLDGPSSCTGLLGPEVHDDERSVVGKVFRILSAFRHPAEELALADLIDRTVLSKTTVHRIASDLVQRAVLERTRYGYRLGMRLFELGQRVAVQRILRDIALPFMQDLYEASHEVVHLGVLDGSDVVYVEKIVGHRAAQTPSMVGSRMPAYCTALGKAMLAFAEPDVVNRVVAGLVARTPYTIVDSSLFLQELSHIKEKKVADDREEGVPGLACVASPVFWGNSSVVAAVSITGPFERFKSEHFGAAVKVAASGISRAIGSRYELMPPGRR